MTISLGLPIEAIRADAQRYNAQQPFQAPVKDVNLVRNTVQLQVGGSAGYQWYRCFADIPLSDTLVGEMACVVFFDGEPVVAGFLWEEAGTFIHSHSSDDEGGQLDWDDIWSDAVHDHSNDAEGGQLDWDDIWADAVHDHSAAGEGGQLDWDAVWSDAVHDHSAAGEGGQLDHGALTGLADDDHTIYLLASGARALTGAWDVGAFLVTFGAGIAFDGGSGTNLVTVPTALAQALKLIDTNAIEYMRVDSAPQLAILFNILGADIDFYISSAGLANAFVIAGDTGHIGMGLTPSAFWHVAIRNLAVDTASYYRGLYLSHTKTAGATNYANELTGIHNVTGFSQVGGEIGRFRGIANTVSMSTGTVGSVANNRSVYGIWNEAKNSDVIYGNLYGAYHYVYNSDTLSGTGNLWGIYVDARVLGGSSIAGDLIGLEIFTQDSGTVAGTRYMLKLNQGIGCDWAIHHDGTAPSHLGGRTSIGATIVTAAQLHVDQSNGLAAWPVLLLDQAADDEPFIKFIGDGAADTSKNISTQNGDGVVEGPKNYVAANGWTFTGMLRIEVQDESDVIADQDYWIPIYEPDTS